MKEIIVHSNYDILNKNNNLFNNIGDVSVKDFLNQMYELKMYGLENDINLVSSDGINIQVADSFIFIDQINLFSINNFERSSEIRQRFVHARQSLWRGGSN